MIVNILLYLLQPFFATYRKKYYTRLSSVLFNERTGAMKLTEYEQQMMAGKMGEFKQFAIQNIVKYAQALGANELCEVTKATLFLGNQGYLTIMDTDDYDTIFSQMYLCAPKTIPLDFFDEKCACQTCVTGHDDCRHRELNMPEEGFHKNKLFLSKVIEKGVSMAGSCTPYLTGWLPIFGEHFVTTESSNVLMSNAVFGARGNADGIEAAAWSAICGRTPLWGFHVTQNRYATHVFELECSSETEIDWDVIGQMVGKRLPPMAVPVISGKFSRPDIAKLKQFCAALATVSCAEMFHIVGATPEAPTLETALGGKAPFATTSLTQDDFDHTFRALCAPGGGTIQFVTLGCPHYTLEELRQISWYIKGKRVHPDVLMIVNADISIKAMSDISGYTKMIEDAGAYLVTSGCALAYGKECFEHACAMASDSSKQVQYLGSETSMPIYYGDKYRCIDAAVAGRWET